MRKILRQMGTELEPDVRNEATNEISSSGWARTRLGASSDGSPRTPLDEGAWPDHLVVPGLRTGGVVTEPACRSCGAGDLEVVLSLGKMPLANALLTTDQLTEPEPLPAGPRLLPALRACSDHRGRSTGGALR